MDTSPPDSRAWSKARDLFLDFADLPASEREAELAELQSADPQMAGWVQRLIDKDLGACDPAEDPSTGQVFGPYETVRRIAVGGMGEVLLARRSDGEFERDVAIKRLRGGAIGKEILERFLRERQTLARLDHEYIARLLDGGTSEAGEPYLVLEYVDGRHIDVYCREEGLSIDERVDLFLGVLEAVAHAHERGVVHRDLKPSNILIRADGSPRLLDFGIARSEIQGVETPTLTGTGQRLFTPEFASPEQVRGERATPVSDVFSLGVILYKLLATQGPWQKTESLFQLERDILEHDPVAPSRHLEGRERRLVVGDLDTIILHCLKKRASKRYASVEELRHDLEQYIADRPITARPTRKLERLVRYSRRNPWQAVAAVVLGLALTASWFALRSNETAENRGEELVTTLEARVNHALSLREQGRNEDALTELSAVLESLDSVEDEPELRLHVIAQMSRLLQEVGQIEASMEFVDRGFALLPPDPGQHADVRARLLLSALYYHRTFSEPEGALAAAEEAYWYTQEWFEPGHYLRLHAIESLATDRSIPLDDRVTLIEEGIAEARAAARPHDGVLGSLLTTGGVMKMEKQEFEAALEYIDEALVIDRWNHGEGHEDVGMGRYGRGVCFLNLGRLDEAKEELEAAHETFERTGHDELAIKAQEFLGHVEHQGGAP